MISTKNIPSFTILLPVISLVSITLFVLFMINSIKDDLIDQERQTIIEGYHQDLKLTLSTEINEIISQAKIQLEEDLVEHKHFLLQKLTTLSKFFTLSTKYTNRQHDKLLLKQIQIVNENNPLYHLEILTQKSLNNLLSSNEKKRYKKEKKLLRHDNLNYNNDDKKTLEYILPFKKQHLRMSIHKERFIAEHKDKLIQSLIKANQNKSYALHLYQNETKKSFTALKNTQHFFEKYILEDKALMLQLKNTPKQALLKDYINEENFTCIAYLDVLPYFKWIISVSIPIDERLISEKLAQNEKELYFKKRTEELLMVIVIVSAVILLISLIMAKIINTLFIKFKRKIEEQNSSLKNFNDELTAKVDEKIKELEASEKRYRTIFERSRDGVLVLDNDKVSYCNDALLKMFQIGNKSSIIEHSIKQLLPQKQSDAQDSLSVLHEYLDITFALGHSRLDMLLLKHNQQTFYADVWLQMIELEGKQSIYIVIRDIDFQKKAHEKIKNQHQELLTLNETLEEKVKFEVQKNQEKEQLLVHQSRLAQMGEMISMIAHQWRQPLNAISTSSANMKLLMVLKQYDPVIFQKNLSQIDDYIQHLSETINDFRNFFKPDKKEELTTIDDLIEKSLHIIDQSLKDNEVEVSQEVPKGITLKTYPHELMQVILNILKNAEDILLERKPQDRHIHIKYELIEGYHQLSFHDNAGGIPLDIVDKIFDPYFSTKNQKNGTGLGLYMSKVIISDHCKGRLTAHNQDDGAVFSIFLPKDENL